MLSDSNWLLIQKKVIPALGDTLFMVSISFVIATFIGFLIALLLVCCDDNGLYSNKKVYKLVSLINNILRSFPFTILIVAMIPVTRFIVGTSIGREAALVPLIVALSPFIARLLENSFKEVDYSVVEAAKSFCANRRQIIFRVIVKEAVPSIIMNLTLAVINTLGLSAMAGVVGGGGLGATAIIYGYQSFNDFIMYIIVVILILIVQFVQWIGTRLYKKTIQ